MFNKTFSQIQNRESHEKNLPSALKASVMEPYFIKVRIRNSSVNGLCVVMILPNASLQKSAKGIWNSKLSRKISRIWTQTP